MTFESQRRKYEQENISRLVCCLRSGWKVQLYEGDLLKDDKSYIVTINSPKGVLTHGNIRDLRINGTATLESAKDLEEITDYFNLTSALWEIPYAHAKRIVNLYNAKKLH